jgi:hypothetical protein
LLPLVAVEAFIGTLLEERAAGKKKQGQREEAELRMLRPAMTRRKIQRRLGLRQRRFFLHGGLCQRAIDFGQQIDDVERFPHQVEGAEIDRLGGDLAVA